MTCVSTKLTFSSVGGSQFTVLDGIERDHYNNFVAKTIKLLALEGVDNKIVSDNYPSYKHVLQFFDFSMPAWRMLKSLKVGEEQPIALFHKFLREMPSSIESLAVELDGRSIEKDQRTW